METYTLTLEGTTALIMHWDNIQFSEAIKTWREDPANSKFSVRGDDRSPAFSWLGGLYHDESVVVVPSDNLSRCLMEAGAGVVVPGGRSGKTFKAQTQSGMGFPDMYFPLVVDGKTIDVKPLLALKSEKDFTKHISAAQARGFELFVKRARIGAAKHVRVRPRFHRWSFQATLNVWDEQLTPRVLKDILDIAGNSKGLCDWRPSSKTPGPFGRFTATIK